MNWFLLVTGIPYVLFGIPMMMAFSDEHVEMGMQLLVLLIIWTLDCVYSKIKHRFKENVTDKDIEQFFAEQKKKG